MHADFLGIFPGQTFATADGEEISVLDLDPKSGYAVIETSEHEQGVANLSGMLAAIENGLLVIVEETGVEEET